MYYAAIAPTYTLKNVECFAKRPVQFCLAQEYLKGGEYAEWYLKQACHAEHTVILDNGAWEDALVDSYCLGSVIDTLHPQVFILPDVKDDKRMTTYLHKSFQAYQAAACEYTPEFMSVIQGQDIWDYLEMYQKADTPWIGFPRCMNDHNDDLRVQVAERLQALGLWKKDVKHHALGMYGGDLEECKKLAKLGFYSIDSSNPIWRGVYRQEGDIDFNHTFYKHPNYFTNKLVEVDKACSSQ